MAMNEGSSRTKRSLGLLLMTCLCACHGATAMPPSTPAAAHPPPPPQPAARDSTAPPLQGGTLDAARRRLVLDGIAQQL